MTGLTPQLLSILKPLQGILLTLQETEKDTQIAGRSDFAFWPALINMVAVLALVVGLIVLLGWLLRRFGGARFGAAGGSGLMQMVSMLPLGDKRSLAVVRVGKRYFLIGVSTGQLSNLGELEPEEVEQAVEKKEGAPVEEGGFAAIFSRFRRGKGEDA